ncbi:hypothetical protein BGZ76_002815, partial [Entomortierella beljakovae]
MPRTKLSPTNSTSAATATLNDLTLPYPTPSAPPLLNSPNSPLTALTPPLVLKTPNQQYVRDSTLSLPVGTTLTIPRKSAGNRIGSSILGQLLASHKPNRDHHKLSHDATLSLETIRPKEQQRRSILPMNWMLGFQKNSSIQAVASASTQAPLQQSKGKMVQGSTVNVIENLDQNEDPTSRSEWLESVLSQLSRSESNTLSHYVTLPRVDLHYKQQPSLNLAFSELERQPKDKGNEKGSKSKLNQTLHPPKQESVTKSLARRGSACELALGTDARGLFQQNRPKTLSSAVISSSIVPVKEALRNSEQPSPNPDVSKSPLTQISDKTELAINSSTLSDTTAAATSGAIFNTTTTATTTTRTTKGRFTIESSSPVPSLTRTRTLSCNATTTSIAQQPTFYGQPSTSVDRSSVAFQEKERLSKPPTSPTRSFSLPVPSPTSHKPPRSAQTHTPPSPSLSPSLSRFTVNNDSSANGSGNSPSNPIMIPRGDKSNHQRTQSNSSIQSSGSSSFRRSQVIIPPPVSVSSLQFASFASLTSPGPASTRNATNSSNFRNLSIQIVEKDKCETAMDSHDNQVFYLETPTLHPLETDTSAPGTNHGTHTEMQTAHQTMNRVHPNHDSAENLADSAALSACSTSSSSVSSMSSSLGTHGGSQLSSGFDRSSSGAGYFRQRSLSAINLDSHQGSQRSSIQDSPNMQHHSTWSERPARRTHGSVQGSTSGSNHSTGAIPIKSMSESKSGSSLSSSYSGETSDIVIKKSATGRMFTVERTIPASPTKCSRFIVGAPTPVTTPPPRSPSPFQHNVITR